jgi:hypothetical protein
VEVSKGRASRDFEAASILHATNFEAFSSASIINIWDVFLPTLVCPDVERVGRVGDGGKWVCGIASRFGVPHTAAMTGPLASEAIQADAGARWQLGDAAPAPCVMYSFGISTDISFEMDVLRRTPCEVLAFDPTIGELPFGTLPEGSAWRTASLDEGTRRRIKFRKAALGSGVSGSCGHAHLICDGLLDLMASNDHAFVDFLKVDVEGAEWSIFHQLEVDTRGSPSGLPVGQVMIELHVTASTHVLNVSSFFNAMETWGLIPFSREVSIFACASALARVRSY